MPPITIRQSTPKDHVPANNINLSIPEDELTAPINIRPSISKDQLTATIINVRPSTYIEELTAGK